MKNDNHVWDNKHPTAQMLGRWQPWHDGHQKLFEEILETLGAKNISSKTQKKNGTSMWRLATGETVAEYSNGYVRKIIYWTRRSDNKKLQYICLDVANGYREDFLQFVRKVRKEFDDKIIISGNVATREMTEALILAGADIVKVGIGPGSVCTTRKVAGVGYPQLSAISECADAAHGLGGHVMSDGGCTSPGDIAKAFAAGADFVMLGGMLAGHAESGGELIENEDGTKSKIFYGMSSEKAMTTYFGEVAKHRAPEGKEVRVPYKGKVENTIQSILGGVRSACSYVGARRIKDLPKCTTFVRVTITTNEIYTSHEVS